MYKFAAKEEVARYKAYCQNVLNRLIKKLEKEYAIKAYVTLVGSGAENMVTRNGKGAFDLDYNLMLTSVPSKYEDSPRLLRNHVKAVLDGLVDKRFSPGKDSTSAIRYFAHPQDNRSKVLFSFDVAVIREREGKYKLVYEKGNDVFIWNQVPYSKKLDKKMKAIRKSGRWGEVEEAYLTLKNLYLKRDNRYHPSFIVLAEAVNQVYQTLGH
ncbi:MAG: hypothetical protein NC548_62425 [Lachnospiraceae bacterium]|nr:hypothetical protein [Lachnospiraceae bacterium]